METWNALSLPFGRDNIMQHTEKYQLNLIEPSDPFLPDGLNQNTKQVEVVLSAHEARVKGWMSGIDTTLTAAVKNLGSGGKNARIAWGSYNGNGMHGENSPTVIISGFYPVFAVVFDPHCAATTIGPSFMIRNLSMTHPTTQNGGEMMLKWLDDRIQMWSGNAATQNNSEYIQYFYLIIGFDKNS